MLICDSDVRLNVTFYQGGGDIFALCMVHSLSGCVLHPLQI